jgi:hypothetical protein
MGFIVVDGVGAKYTQGLADIMLARETVDGVTTLGGGWSALKEVTTAGMIVSALQGSYN